MPAPTHNLFNPMLEAGAAVTNLTGPGLTRDGAIQEGAAPLAGQGGRNVPVTGVGVLPEGRGRGERRELSAREAGWGGWAALDGLAMTGHMRTLLNYAPVALAMFDREMRYLFANQRWMEDFKLPQTEVTGRSHYELFPSLHPGWRHVYERALEGQVVRCDRDVTVRGGRTVVYRWEVRPWRQADTSIGGVMISCATMESQGGPSEPTVELQQEVLTGLDALWEGELPMLALDRRGMILRASRGASAFLLPKGLEEGWTSFWEALGERGEGGTLRERVLASLEEVLAGGRGQEVIRTLTSAEGEGDMPSHWLMTRLDRGTGAPAGKAAVLMVGLENVPMLPPVHLPVGGNSGPGQEEWENRLKELEEAECLSRSRENRLRAVLDLAPCGLLVLDERARLIYRNERLTELLGRGPELGQRVEDWLVMGCRDEEHRREVCQRWQDGVWRRQLTLSMTLATTDELLKDIEMRPVALPGGAMMVMLQDVTEARRSEEMLRSTEAKFRTLVHENPAAVVLTDRSGAVFDVNPVAEMLLGYPRAELRRMPLEGWLEEESVGGRAELLKEMQNLGMRSGELNAVVLSPGNVGQRVKMRVAVIADEAGQPKFAAHFLLPVDKEAEERLIPEVGFLIEEENPIMDNAGEAKEEVAKDLLLGTDEWGRVTVFSTAATELFGYMEEDVIGQGLHLLFSPSDPVEFYRRVEEAAPGAVRWSFFRKDGDAGQAWFVLGHRESGPLAVELGLAEPGRDEAAPAMVKETPEVAASQRLVVGETFQRVKNHLQVISSMLNLQLSTLRNEEARQVLRASQSRIRSIAALHQHLHRIAAGEETDFRAFADGLVEGLRECLEVGDERVVLELEVPQEAVPAGWLLPLALALNEMVANAFKHGYPGDRRGRLQVSLGWDEDLAALRVKDDGVGLPADFEDRHHSGMGMKILRVFAGQLGGEIRVLREPEGGAEFALEFPVSGQPDVKAGGVLA